MTNSPATDREILTHQAYANDELLKVRQRTHELYSFPQLNFKEWVLDRIAWRGDERVLDIGAGPGSYFTLTRGRIPKGQLVAGDLSLGMARQAVENPDAGTVLNFDAQTLPFSDGAFDVILANHMLYHVPDLDATLVEFRRVLRPNGCMVAATNSQYNLPEFEQLIRRAYGLLGAVGPDIEPMYPMEHNFALEDGAVRMARHFFAVERFDLPSALSFPRRRQCWISSTTRPPCVNPQSPGPMPWTISFA